MQATQHNQNKYLPVRRLTQGELTHHIRQLNDKLSGIDIAGYHRNHRESILPKYPRHIRASLMREYFEIAGPTRTWPDGPGAGKYDSWAKANGNLRRRDEQLQSAKVHLAFSEDSIQSKAGRCAAICRHIAKSSRSITEAFSRCCVFAESEAVTPPVLKSNIVTVEGAVNRMCCRLWWRRALRTTFARSAENRMRELGLVSNHAGIYASDDTVNRRLEQRKRNRQMLEGLLAINDLGEAFSLAEISDRNISNPKIRRCEVMARLAGLEEFARGTRLVCDHYTLTVPSRFHCVNSTGHKNPNFESSTPRDSHDWLKKNWTRIRSKLARDNISAFGVRIAEPHHDGTAHWHVLVFSSQKSRLPARRIFRHHMLQDTPNERGAQNHRVRITPIDYRRGSATGYIAKYISKNIDGQNVGRDFEDNDNINCKDNVVRVEAWASTWGIRQFQFFGAPPIGPWRELRRIRESLRTGLERFRRAVDKGDWRRYLTLMGGTCRRIADYPVLLWRQLCDGPSRYGDPPGYKTIGVTHGDDQICTRDRIWAIVPIDPLEFCQ